MIRTRVFGTISASIFALSLGGCATSQELEAKARRHDMRADAAAQLRDYEVANREKQEAQELHEKAVKKAVKEGAAGSVIVPAAPASVPHGPPTEPVPVEPVPAPVQ